jgi:hypothetical protein
MRKAINQKLKILYNSLSEYFGDGVATGDCRHSLENIERYRYE